MDKKTFEKIFQIFGAFLVSIFIWNSINQYNTFIGILVLIGIIFFFAQIFHKEEQKIKKNFNK